MEFAIDNWPQSTMEPVPGGYRIGNRGSFAIYLHLLKDDPQQEIVLTMWVFGTPMHVSSHQNIDDAKQMASGLWRSMGKNLNSYRMHA